MKSVGQSDLTVTFHFTQIFTYFIDERGGLVLRTHICSSDQAFFERF